VVLPGPWPEIALRPRISSTGAEMACGWGSAGWSTRVSNACVPTWCTRQGRPLLSVAVSILIAHRLRGVLGVPVNSSPEEVPSF